MKKLLNKKGFTLIELIVVIAILAILAAILIPSIMNYIDAAEDAKNSANARANYTEYMLNEASPQTGWTLDTACTVPATGYDFYCEYTVGSNTYYYEAPDFEGTTTDPSA